MKTLFFLLTLILTSSLVAQEAEGYTIELEITNIDGKDGQMLIGLYTSKEGWLKEPHIGLFGQIVDGKSTASFKNIPDGTYAISTFHDEDNDGELDTFLGIPTEDTGSSNGAQAIMGPPKWNDAKFVIQGESIKQTIKL